MQTKIVFQTDHLGIFVGEAIADPSPLEDGVWLIPGGCVELAPPEIPEHKAAHWDGQRWQLIDSYLGLTAYNTQTREPVAIDRHGQLPAGFTLEPPKPGQVWKDGDWIDDVPAAVEQLYQVQVAAVDSACSREITGGFWSMALGDRQCYSSAVDDQQNLIGAAALATDVDYPCTDETGLKAFRTHTAAQLRQVADEFTVLKLQRLQRSYALKERLQQAREAKDLAALGAVTWEADAR